MLAPIARRVTGNSGKGRDKFAISVPANVTMECNGTDKTEAAANCRRALRQFSAPRPDHHYDAAGSSGCCTVISFERLRPAALASYSA